MGSYKILWVTWDVTNKIYEILQDHIKSYKVIPNPTRAYQLPWDHTRSLGILPNPCDLMWSYIVLPVLRFLTLLLSDMVSHTPDPWNCVTVNFFFLSEKWKIVCRVWPSPRALNIGFQSAIHLSMVHGCLPKRLTWGGTTQLHMKWADMCRIDLWHRYPSSDSMTTLWTKFNVLHYHMHEYI